MIFFFFLFSLGLGISLLKNGINILTEENLEYALESNATVLGVWNAVDCKKCAADMWDVYQLFYTYGREKDFLIMASNLGDSPELEKKYDIPLSDEGSIYRLFVRGSPTPFALNEDGLDVETWIALKTGYIPRENHVFHLSDDTHSTFLKMTKKADAFVMLYIPQNPKSQKVSTMFAQLADLFSNDKHIKFAQVNCYETPGLCEFLNAPHVPAFRYVPWNTTAWHGKQIQYDDGENMLDYINTQLNTFYESDGSMNNHFGREEVLDTLAHEFMECNERKCYLSYMKKVSKLKNTYRASYRYYKVMKEVLSKGNEGLIQYQEQLESQIANVTDFTNNEYLKLRALQNVANQFEVLPLNQRVVVLNNYNFDYVINGKRDVLVLFYSSEAKEENEFLTVYSTMAMEGYHDFIFTSMDIDTYYDFALHYHIRVYPSLVWFKKDDNPHVPYIVNADLTKEKVIQYLDEQLTPIVEEEKEL